MGKHFSKYATTSGYEADESTLAIPHVSLTKDNMVVHYKPNIKNNQH